MNEIADTFVHIVMFAMLLVLINRTDPNVKKP